MTATNREELPSSFAGRIWWPSLVTQEITDKNSEAKLGRVHDIKASLPEIAKTSDTRHTWPIFDVWWAIFKQGGFLRFCIDNNPRLYNKGLKVNILYLFYFNLGEDIGEDQNLGELFLSWKSPGETYPILIFHVHFQSVLSVYFIWTLSATKTFFLLRSTFLIVITDRIHFDGFLTNWTFISLVSLDMVVKCFLANANFVTNVTLHVFYTMNYPMEP